MARGFDEQASALTAHLRRGGLGSELITCRNDRAKIREPDRQIQGDQQASQAAYCD
jgi:hypothetical protein